MQLSFSTRQQNGHHAHTNANGKYIQILLAAYFKAADKRPTNAGKPQMLANVFANSVGK